MKKVKMIDVATLANVSKSTVSQYLNGRFGHMSAPTKERIKTAIEELNYVPNQIARSLKSNKTKTIGVIVRDIAGFNTSLILRGIDDFCKHNGYNVLIYNSDFDAEIERQSLESLKQIHVDGIILTSSGQNVDLINQYASNGFPIVQFQLEYENSQTDIVISDYFTAAKQATEYLIELGHQRIAFVTQNFENNPSRLQRYQGYETAMIEHGFKVDPTLIQYWDRQNSFANPPLSTLNSSNPPTAFFTQHLAITVDLLKVLNEHEIAIYKDVSVLGFDEIPMVDLFKVPITVVKQDAYTVGSEAAKLLMQSILTERTAEKIDDSTQSQSVASKVVVPCALVKRNSCRNLSVNR